MFMALANIANFAFARRGEGSNPWNDDLGDGDREQDLLARSLIQLVDKPYR
jgi:hypothetical protein